MKVPGIVMLAVHCIVLGAFVARCGAEEIWLADNTRLYGLVTGLKGNSFEITLPGGEVKYLPLAQVIEISFRGRTPRFVEVGSQEFIFQRGGSLRGQISGQSGENISVTTPASGAVNVDTRKLNGLIGLPIEGSVGRRAADLLAMEKGPNGPNLDQILDRRGSRYPGVVERVDRSSIILDHEDVLRAVPFSWSDVAGVRLANADKTPMPPVPADPYLRITLRDGSRFDGVLQRIGIGSWHLRPLWEETMTIPVDVNEIVSAQVMSGNVQYLSQLTVSSARETSLIAPPHAYRLDRNCEGGGLSIGGLTFPWGIGVHANSELTYDLNKRFKKFCATIGLDSAAGREGTVVFRVVGDGKELYRSPILKASDAPVEISLPIDGVSHLSLCVDDANGSDLGDAADWGVARVVR